MIKSIFKIFIGVIISSCIISVVFFLFASSANLNEDQYNKIFKYSYTYAEKDTLSIMTYNLGFLSGMTNGLPIEVEPSLINNNQDRLLSLISDLQPDLIAFQEIDFDAARSLHKNQLSFILKEGKFNNGSRVINWDKKYVPFPYWPISAHFGKIISGQAIASNYPILENRRVSLSKPESSPFYYNAFYLDRLIQINKIRIGDREVAIMNVHLEAFDKETRVAQSLVVLENYNELSKSYPVILLGDFNATPELKDDDQTIFNIMKGQNIKRAIVDSVYLSNRNNNFTFNSVNPDRKLDYIFYNSSKIKALEARVVSEAKDISDHIPVIMKFSIF